VSHKASVWIGSAIGLSIFIGCALALGDSSAGAQPWQRYLEGYHGPYRGKAIDAETKEPLEGAVVVAIWRREEIQLFRRATVFHQAREALTDGKGDFILEAEDIERNAPARTWRPTFIILFPGYGWFPRYQVSPREFLRGIFEGQGATVELPRLKAHEERMDVIGGLPPSVLPDEKIPHLIRLMNIERVNLGLQPVHLPKEN
jgi:hypothetical protein